MGRARLHDRFAGFARLEASAWGFDARYIVTALRDAVPRRMPLAWSEFATIRRSLLKIGARVVEKAARVRIHFASACPNGALFRMLAGRLATAGP